MGWAGCPAARGAPDGESLREGKPGPLQGVTSGRGPPCRTPDAISPPPTGGQAEPCAEVPGSTFSGFGKHSQLWGPAPGLPRRESSHGVRGRQVASGASLSLLVSMSGLPAFQKSELEGTKILPLLSKTLFPSY